MDNNAIVLLVLILAGAVAFDFGTDKIPNWYIITANIILLAYKFTQSSKADLIGTLVSILFPVLVLFPVFIIGGIGGGDIKLLSLAGYFFTPKAMLMVILKALVAGLIIGLIKVFVNRSFLERFRYLYRFFKILYLKLLNKEDVFEERYFDSLDTESLKQGCIHLSLPITIGVITSIGG